MGYVRKLGAWTGPVIGIVAVLLGMVLPPALVHAQATSGGTTNRPPLSLTTSPIPLSIITQPGKTVTADLRVKNNGSQPETLKIDLLKFGASGENGNPQLHEREAKDTYFDWVSFSENRFVAEPNVWKTIKMTIKTPPSAAFGYYLAVLFSRANPTKPTGGASSVEGGVASLVLLDVEAPGAKRQAQVMSLSSTRKVYEFLPAAFDIRLRNPGNVHVAPTGSIFIKRGGAQIGQPIDFNTQRGNILPGTNRNFTASWNDGFPYYETKVNGTKTTKSLKWDFSKLQKLRIGRYTATLVAVYDDGHRDVPVEGSVSFWVIPWRILGALLLIVLFIGIGLWAILRGIWKNIRRNSGSKPKPSKADKRAAKKSAADTAMLAAETATSDDPVPAADEPQKPDAAEASNDEANNSVANNTEDTKADKETTDPPQDPPAPTTAPEIKG